MGVTEPVRAGIPRRAGQEARRGGFAGRRLTLLQQEELVSWLFVLPWIFGFVAFIAGPMLYSLYLSLTEASMLRPPVYVGLLNYRNLFSFDEVTSLFWKTLYNTSYYVFISVPLGIVVGFAIALMLNQDVVGRGVWRTIYYLPSIIPGVAVSLLWILIFNKEFGVLNNVLAVVGIEGPAWLYEERWAKPALIIMSLWGAGGPMLIFLAGLQGIPTELFDAAKVDGAGLWPRFRHITIPMVSPTIFFVLITGIIGSFQVFTNTYVMTQGGPNNSTMMYVLYLFNLAFQQFRMGYASALAWIYFIIIMFFTVLIFRSSAAWVYYEAGIAGGE
ncbi:MAG: sugar ABC transporter permease [Anaerolineae bacterium]|nr:sugar ABC transporter permease [Anaerolineae bacterium]